MLSIWLEFFFSGLQIHWKGKKKSSFETKQSKFHTFMINWVFFACSNTHAQYAYLKIDRNSFYFLVKTWVKKFNCLIWKVFEFFHLWFFVLYTCVYIVVIGGWEIPGYRYVPTLEVISTEGQCTSSIPPLPKGLSGHKSVYFNGNLWVCGGALKGAKKSKECMLLKDSNSKWTVGPEMNELRYMFSMAKVWHFDNQT